MGGFLPVCPDDIKQRGWDAPDFVYVIGDAYVDHSSFGPAVISRVLESHGYRVAIIAQPDIHDENSISVFGSPRLGFLVSAGNMDSMVNHYTVNKRRRSSDAYSPGGKAGMRPDYATVVYCNMINRRFKECPVIIGGVEASLRRLGHYDYWSNRVRRSVLLDSGADLLLYGMGELTVVQVADALDKGIPVERINFIDGTVYKTPDISRVKDGIVLHGFDEIRSDKRKFAESFAIQLKNSGWKTAKPLIECYGNNRYVVQNPPARPLTESEMDRVYELPYMNAWHPMYDALGGVPALAEVKFSLTSSRGCFGSCSFCSIAFHQGRIVQVRSHPSLVREAERMTHDPNFKGYIHDVGGPTADFRAPACAKQTAQGACVDRQCLFPKPCPNLKADHGDYVSLLRELREVPGVKKVFIRSGVRFDYVMADRDDTFMHELCAHHISGQLRVAPEHVSDRVLDLMGKPHNDVYRSFCRKFDKINASTGKEQYVVPYLISSHPGSTLRDAVALAESIRDMGYMPEQVQDFYPTPMTVSTCMYYTGLDPRTMQPVYVADDPMEKKMQRALIQYRLPENYSLVYRALVKCGRRDLIGPDRAHCLIPNRVEAGHGDVPADSSRSAKRSSGSRDHGGNTVRERGRGGSHYGPKKIAKKRNGK